MTTPGEATSEASWWVLSDWEPCEAGCGKRVSLIERDQPEPRRRLLLEDTLPPPGVWAVGHTARRCRALRATT